MVLVGHCTLNDWAAAGHAAMHIDTNNKLAVPNFLLPMRPPSSPPRAAVFPNCGDAGLIKRAPQETFLHCDRFADSAFNAGDDVLFSERSPLFLAIG